MRLKQWQHQWVDYVDGGKVSHGPTSRPRTAGTNDCWRRGISIFSGRSPYWQGIGPWHYIHTSNRNRLVFIYLLYLYVCVWAELKKVDFYKIQPLKDAVESRLLSFVSWLPHGSVKVCSLTPGLKAIELRPWASETLSRNKTHLSSFSLPFASAARQSWLPPRAMQRSTDAGAWLSSGERTGPSVHDEKLACLWHLSSPHRTCALWSKLQWNMRWWEIGEVCSQLFGFSR